MKKENVLVMLSNGHGSNTIGKQSADGSLREYAYVREIRKRVQKELEEQGYNVFVVTPEEWDVSLKTRVQRINNKYAEVKKKGMKAFCISIHVNAAGSDGKWHNATGWSAFVSNNAS